MTLPLEKSQGRAETIALEVNGQRLLADASGALVWPRQRAVLVADLHLEKGSAFAARGRLLPPYDTAATLARLAAVLERHGAEAMAKGSPDRDLQELLEKCNHQPESLTTQQIGEAAGEGNAFAKSEIEAAARCLGWAVAQVISLLAPEMVVIGGGVSLLGNLFLDPVRRATEAYVFPPLLHSYAIEPAALGEEVVVHGAIQLAVSTPR